MERGLSMNTMEVGTGLALSPKDSAPGLNLGADWRLWRCCQSVCDDAGPQADAETGTADVDPQTLPQTLPHTKETLLPAAAMLMAGLSPAPEMVDPGAMTGQMPSGEADPMARPQVTRLVCSLLLASQAAALDQLSPS